MAGKKDLTQNNPGVIMNKKLVKTLNSQAVSAKKYTVKRDWEPNINVKEIGIGDPNPVLSFKEWSKMTFDKIKS